jgi:uncharacterized membrane protein
MIKRLLKIALIFVLLLLFSSCTNENADDQNKTDYRAKIIDIREEQNIDNQNNNTYPLQHIEIEILEGKYKGKHFFTESFLDVKNYKNFDMYRLETGFQ